ncbi:MAG: DUF4834 family protein [Bacteroidia bacterium]|nr:DUF4834 family protein [Bacteroidia bacterium]
MAFLKFILILLIIYYVFKLMAIYLFPYLLKRFVNRMSGNFRDPQQHQYESGSKKEGEVTIDITPDKKTSDDHDNIGEYVDYEEVK